MRFTRLSAHNFVLSLLGSVFLVFSATSSAAASPRTLESSLKQFLNSSNALSVEEVFSGTSIFDHNGSKALKPASVMKVLTSVVALKERKAYFDFDTTFSTYGLDNGVVKELTVIGGADPIMRTEELHVIARNLKNLGIREIKKLKIDLSRFQDPISASGQRAYQAGSGALPLNFNSYVFELCPTTPGQKARITWEPSEVDVSLVGTLRTSTKGRYDPILDRLSDRRFKVGGVIPYRADCSTYTRSVSKLDTFFGEAFIGHLKAQGIRVNPKLVLERSNPKASSFYVHSSKDLSEILRIQNLYSNNFIAEQVLAAIGLDKAGEFSRQRGRIKAGAYLNNLGFEDKGFSILDGSGLSHENRLSTKQIVRSLVNIYNDPINRVEFEASLPIGGKTGTLRKRNFKGYLRAKTGTLNGVRALAGYIYTANPQRVYAFALLQNNLRSLAQAYRFEEKLVESFLAG